MYANATSLYPRLNDVMDLGTSTLRYNSLFLSGAANVAGVITSSGNITAPAFIGSGAQLTGIVDSSLPATVVRTSRQVISGNGLSGGGDLSSNRTLSVGQGDGVVVGADTVGVDGTVVRTSGNQTISGIKTFNSDLTQTSNHQYRDRDGNKHYWFRTASGAPEALIYWDVSTKTLRVRNIEPTGIATVSEMFLTSTGIVGFTGVITGDGSGITSINGSNITTGTVADARLPTTIVRTSRTVTAGNGLTGGGALSGNIALAVGQGDGISVDATTVGVDSTVVRTTGNQTLVGVKTFTNLPVFSNGANLNNSRIISLATPINGQDAANKAYVDASLNGDGSGLTNLNGSNITTGTVADARLPTTIVRTSRNIIAGNGLTGGGTLTADRTFTVGAGDGITVGTTTVGVDSSVVRTSRTITAGDGLSGGGSLDGDRSLSVNSTVVRTQGDQTIGGVKTFSGVVLSGDFNANNQVVAGVPAPTLTHHAANKGYVDGQDFGIAQTPKPLIAVTGTIYTNTDSKLKIISISGQSMILQTRTNPTTDWVQWSRPVGDSKQNQVAFVGPGQQWRVASGTIETATEFS